MNFGKSNNQPSDNGSSRVPLSLQQIEDALHYAEKQVQRFWGSGSPHEQALIEVERLQKLRDECLRERNTIRG